MIFRQKTCCVHVVLPAPDNMAPACLWAACFVSSFGNIYNPPKSLLDFFSVTCIPLLIYFYSLQLVSGEPIQRVEFSFKHHNINNSVENVTVPVTSNTSKVDWSYTFPQMGVHVLQVAMTTIDDQHHETTSVINVQESVGDIVLRGPSLSKFTWWVPNWL